MAEDLIVIVTIFTARFHGLRSSKRTREKATEHADRQENPAVSVSGKKVLEITPRKLKHVVRPTQGWMITKQPSFFSEEDEDV